MVKEDETLLEYWRLGCKVFRLKGKKVMKRFTVRETRMMRYNSCSKDFFRDMISSDYCPTESKDILCSNKG